MKAMKAVALLKGANPVLNSVRQLVVAFGGMAERMIRVKGTVNEIAVHIHGPVMEPVAEFPIRTEGG